MKLYLVRSGDETDADLNATQRWCLPWVARCRKCGLGPEGCSSGRYPCVDLTGLPAADLKVLEKPRQVRREEFVRLRELVRPLAPPDAVLEPLAGFGPLRGTARGTFGLFHTQGGDLIVVRPGVMTERLGIKLCPQTELRTKTPLLALQLEHHGARHDRYRLPEGPPCEVCGVRPVEPAPPGWELVLDGRSVSGPEVPDLFSLKDGSGLTVATERFVEWVGTLRRSEPVGIRFEPVAVAMHD